MTDEEWKLYQRIEEYIRNHYQKYEAERKGLGFIMTVYRRRLTSSFYAIPEPPTPAGLLEGQTMSGEAATTFFEVLILFHENRVPGPPWLPGPVASKTWPSARFAERPWPPLCPWLPATPPHAPPGSPRSSSTWFPESLCFPICPGCL